MSYGEIAYGEAAYGEDAGSTGSPPGGTASLTLTASGVAAGVGGGSGSLSLAGSAAAGTTGSGSLSLSASGSPVPSVGGAGSLSLSAGGAGIVTYNTDTSNDLDGLDLLLSAAVTFAPAVATVPSTLVAAAKYDKAIAYPVPVMVNGRPT